MLRRFLKMATYTTLGLCMAAPVFAQPKPAAVNTPEFNKNLLRQFYEEIMNKKDMARFDEFLGASFVEHQVAPGFTPDRDGTRKFFNMYTAAFPDLKVTVDAILAEGDLAAAAVTVTGTQKGEFMGAPASGKSFKMMIVDIVRIKDGKAVEHWGGGDDLGMMQQLGIAPH
jgi:steroid delta-isomerase-like uncharacterized protein